MTQKINFDQAIINNDINVIKSILSEKNITVTNRNYNTNISKALELKYFDLANYLINHNHFLQTDRYIGFIIYSKLLPKYDNIIKLLFKNNHAKIKIEQYNPTLFKELTIIDIKNKVSEF